MQNKNAASDFPLNRFEKKSMFVTQAESDDIDGVLIKSLAVGERFENGEGSSLTWKYEDLRASAWGEHYRGSAFSLGYRFADAHGLSAFSISAFDLANSNLWNIDIDFALIDRYLDVRLSSGEFLWWQQLDKNEYEIKLHGEYRDIRMNANYQRIFVSDDNIIDDFGATVRYEVLGGENTYLDAIAVYHSRVAQFNSGYYWSPDRREEVASPGVEFGYKNDNHNVVIGFRHELGVNGQTDDSNSYSAIYEIKFTKNVSANLNYLRGNSYRSENPYWWKYMSLGVSIVL